MADVAETAVSVGDPVDPLLAFSLPPPESTSLQELIDSELALRISGGDSTGDSSEKNLLDFDVNQEFLSTPIVTNHDQKETVVTNGNHIEHESPVPCNGDVNNPPASNYFDDFDDFSPQISPIPPPETTEYGNSLIDISPSQECQQQSQLINFGPPESKSPENHVHDPFSIESEQLEEDYIPPPLSPGFCESGENERNEPPMFCESRNEDDYPGFSLSTVPEEGSLSPPDDNINVDSGGTCDSPPLVDDILLPENEAPLEGRVFDDVMSSPNDPNSMVNVCDVQCVGDSVCVSTDNTTTTTTIITTLDEEEYGDRVIATIHPGGFVELVDDTSFQISGGFLTEVDDVDVQQLQEDPEVDVQQLQEDPEVDVQQFEEDLEEYVQQLEDSEAVVQQPEEVPEENFVFKGDPIVLEEVEVEELSEAVEVQPEELSFTVEEDGDDGDVDVATDEFTYSTAHIPVENVPEDFLPTEEETNEEQHATYNEETVTQEIVVEELVCNGFEIADEERQEPIEQYVVTEECQQLNDSQLSPARDNVDDHDGDAEEAVLPPPPAEHVEVFSSSGTETDSDMNDLKPEEKKLKKKKRSEGGEKKTKKSKKGESEKENISVLTNGHGLDHESLKDIPKPDLLDMKEACEGVSIQSLKQTYCSQASKGFQRANQVDDIVSPSVPLKDIQAGGSGLKVESCYTAGTPTSTTSLSSFSLMAKAKSVGDLSQMSDGSQRSGREPVFTGVSVKALKSSFSKFDQLTKKTVLHVRSVDASKVQRQFNQAAAAEESQTHCKMCGKQVFQMESVKAERAVWHKNCFRCKECNKQLTVDAYQSNEGTLYCKPHFKELFKPKAVVEDEPRVRRFKKPELIIRESQPEELPPDVVRSSDRQDTSLEELSKVDVKSRFQAFEKQTENGTDLDRSPSSVSVKRSPSILSKLARFQKKGMDVGVSDEALNGIPFEESSSSSEEAEEEEEEQDVNSTEIVKATRKKRERPMSFGKMDDVRTRWETGNSTRREEMREERKQEIVNLRSRLFHGKQGKMKEMYEQAVMESERGSPRKASGDTPASEKARLLKERFERGEPIHTDSEDDEEQKNAKDEELSVFESAISKKSRSLFLELDASAAKTQTLASPKSPHPPVSENRRAKEEESPEREVYRDPDVVRSDDPVESKIVSNTASRMLSVFRQMEEKSKTDDVPDGPKPLKRFTPPPDYTTGDTESSEEEEEDEEEDEEDDEEEQRSNPNIVRASDKIEDEFLKQNADRAKALRAKFEKWEATVEKENKLNLMEGDDNSPSIDTTRNLRARFEAMKEETQRNVEKPRPKVNRFVEIQNSCAEMCCSCERRVYAMEKTDVGGKVFHKACFKCFHCSCILRMETYTVNNGRLYCLPHFKQLFIAKGNYDEGFGGDQPTQRWTKITNGYTNGTH